MKKLLPIIALLLVCATSSFAGIKIYVRAAATPSIWAWNPLDASENYTGGSWPGWPMTYERTVDGVGLYSCAFGDEITALNLIISNSGSNQTKDIENITADTYIEYDKDNADQNTNCEILSNATISTVAVKGSFDSWGSGLALTSGGANTWTGTFDLTATEDDIEFKLVPNDGTDHWLGYGNACLSVVAPFGWIEDSGEPNHNLKLKNSATGYKTYTVTATWVPNPFGGDQWTLTIAGADDRYAFTGYKLIGSTGAWTVGASLAKSGDVYSIDIPYVSNYSFAIAPTSAINGSDEIVVWERVVRPGAQTEVEFANIGDDAVKGYGLSQNWHMRTLAANESNEYTATLSYNSSTDKWTITCAANVVVGTTGYATYSNAKKYQVSGAEVYTVTEATTTATLNKLADGVKLPAGTGVILKGTVGSSTDVTITPVSDDPASIGTNMLVGSGDYSYEINSGSTYKDYILANKSAGVGFYLLDPSNKTLAAHKAFLRTVIGLAPDFLGFDEGETTGVNEVRSQLDEVRECYDLQGRRVAQPTKGLYIVNGKKVVIK